MLIAICDADNVFAKDLKSKLYSYSNKYRLDFVIEIFKKGEELLNSQRKYSLIFIEYYLVGMNGLETSKLLRKKNINSKIIFISQNIDFVFEIFQVNPYRFLKKPLDEKELFKMLDEYFSDNHTHYPLRINEGNDTLFLDTNEILYIEADNKHCRIHLNNRTIPYKKTMARVFADLPKMHFQKINRAFIVNLDAITKYNSENVILKNGEKLRITRTYFKNFKQNYQAYSLPKVL